MNNLNHAITFTILEKIRHLSILIEIVTMDLFIAEKNNGRENMAALWKTQHFVPVVKIPVVKIPSKVVVFQTTYLMTDFLI